VKKNNLWSIVAEFGRFVETMAPFLKVPGDEEPKREARDHENPGLFGTTGYEIELIWRQ
jgi:hypothetical protein